MSKARGLPGHALKESSAALSLSTCEPSWTPAGWTPPLNFAFQAVPLPSGLLQPGPTNSELGQLPVLPPRPLLQARESDPGLRALSRCAFQAPKLPPSLHFPLLSPDLGGSLDYLLEHWEGWASQPQLFPGVGLEELPSYGSPPQAGSVCWQRGLPARSAWTATPAPISCAQPRPQGDVPSLLLLPQGQPRAYALPGRLFLCHLW